MRTQFTEAIGLPLFSFATTVKSKEIFGADDVVETVSVDLVTLIITGESYDGSITLSFFFSHETMANETIKTRTKFKPLYIKIFNTFDLYNNQVIKIKIKIKHSLEENLRKSVGYRVRKSCFDQSSVPQLVKAIKHFSNKTY